jgi:hypothetical protein
MTAPQGFRRNKRVVYVAIGVNLGIAATKFIAASVSNDPAVAAVNRVLTMYIGPSEVLLNLNDSSTAFSRRHNCRPRCGVWSRRSGHNTHTSNASSSRP